MAADTPRFRKRLITITSTGASTAKAVGLGGVKYGKLIGFRAKASADTTTTIGIADALGRTLYLDAAAKDYATAFVNRVIVWDETTPVFTFTDHTGAAIAGTNMVLPAPVAESPVTITWGSVDAAGRVLQLQLYFEV